MDGPRGVMDEQMEGRGLSARVIGIAIISTQLSR